MAALHFHIKKKTFVLIPYAQGFSRWSLKSSDFSSTKVGAFVLLFMELRPAVICRETDRLSPKETLGAAALGLQGAESWQHKVTPPTGDAGGLAPQKGTTGFVCTHLLSYLLTAATAATRGSPATTAADLHQLPKVLGGSSPPRGLRVPTLSWMYPDEAWRTTSPAVFYYTGLKAVEQQPDHISDCAMAAWKGQH